MNNPQLNESAMGNSNSSHTASMSPSEGIPTTFNNNERRSMQRRASDQRSEVILKRSKAKHSDVTWFISQLAVMIETGMPISEALTSLSQKSKRLSMRTALTYIAKEVEHGKPLSQAIRQAPSKFDPGLIALVSAGEESGQLGSVLTKAHEYMSQEMLLMKRFKSAMAYPILMIVICISVVLFLMLFVLPKFTSLFEGKDSELPIPTRMLLGISDHLMAEWFWWFLLTNITILGLNLWFATSIGGQIRDRIVLSFPIFGKTLNTLYQARAFRGFAVMLDSGVSIIQAVDITVGIVPNSIHKSLWSEVGSRARNGDRVSEAFSKSSVIPDHIAQMIESGDQSGRLGFVFHRLATYLEADYELSIKSLIQVIEPIMIALMGIVVGFIASALMLPLFQAGGVMSS
tara:strand:- start:125911 stop:127116 length:1206 start_codon:yes stop_codon:yes gene_type:complete